MKRRKFLQRVAVAAAAAAVSRKLEAADSQVEASRRFGAAIVIDPRPRFKISPHLYMQFMEPLGVTDSSVEAAWDYVRDDWRKDFVEATADLAPGMLRFGGLLSRYYKWREGVGSPARRPLYRNYVWGGKETHRVGTHEFVDFCRRVKAEPMYCVNFASDGETRFAGTPEGNRSGDAQEAADWVSYANEPDHPERKANGAPQPFNLKYWQLGNETSYGNAVFKKDQAIAETIEFATAMRQRDRGLKLIGWGDNGWAGDLAHRAGEYIDYVAVHMMGQTPVRRDTVLRGTLYQAQPERAWEELMELIEPRVERKLIDLEKALAQRGSKLPIAITEGHLSLAPHNSNPILTEWLTGVYHARIMNLYQRHGDRVKISTAADFNGTRWTTNAVIHQVPGGVTYLLPVAAVMRLFKRHNGDEGVLVKSAPGALDIAASRITTGGQTAEGGAQRPATKVFLHVANTNYSAAVEATFAVDGMEVSGGRVLEIATENPRQEVGPLNPTVFQPKEHVLEKRDSVRWRFPARSVSVVELDCA